MKIDKAIVGGKAKNLTAYIGSIKTEVGNLKSFVSEMNDAWKGKKATEFSNNLNNSYIKELENLEGILENYSDFLGKVPRAYEMLDEEYGNKNIDV